MNAAHDEWEVPYIPPEGIRRECLMPDGCTSCDAPVMSELLLPLSRFDLAPLRQVTPGEGFPHRGPYWELDLFLRKGCAGLAHAWRITGAEFREALRTGVYTERHKFALSWAFSGMRRKYVFPGLIAGAEVPIFEVARCFWVAFGGQDFGCGPWLNQWAKSPERPHPKITELARVRRDAPWLLETAGVSADTAARSVRR